MKCLVFLVLPYFIYAYNGEDKPLGLECFRAHEVISCEYDCPPEKTCDNRFHQFYCSRPPSVQCVNKCVCEPYYYRNADGDCITEAQCEQCSGPNEYFACSGFCDNVCAKLDTENRTSCPVVNVKCNEKCYCRDGYARDCDNICIPIENCDTYKH